MPETMQQVLRERSAEDQPAILHDDLVLSWRRYVGASETEAAALLALVDREQPVHIGTLMANSPQMLRSMAAAALGGYVLCGVNTTRRGAGLSGDILRAECQVLLTDDEHLPLVETIADDLAAAKVRVINTDTDEWSDLLDGAGALTPYREVEAMDTFMMIFTSGTSGDPKAVQVTHLLPLFSGMHLMTKVDITAEDVCLHLHAPLPLERGHGRLGAEAAVARTMALACTVQRVGASSTTSGGTARRTQLRRNAARPTSSPTPERPDDATTRCAIFGNEASARDIDGSGALRVRGRSTASAPPSGGSASPATTGDAARLRRCGGDDVRGLQPRDRRGVPPVGARRERGRLRTPTRRSASWST